MANVLSPSPISFVITDINGNNDMKLDGTDNNLTITGSTDNGAGFLPNNCNISVRDTSGHQFVVPVLPNAGGTATQLTTKFHSVVAQRGRGPKKKKPGPIGDFGASTGVIITVTNNPNGNSKASDSPSQQTQIA